MADSSSSPPDRGKFLKYTGWVTVAIAAVAILILLFWPVADTIATHDVQGASAAQRVIQLRLALDAARGRLIQICAGALALGAFIYTARNYRIAQQQSELNRRTLQLSVQGQITDRYTKAIDQIGAGELEVRIGALHALEQVATDFSADYAAVLDVISAFVRHHTNSMGDAGGYPREDVSTAMTIISNLNTVPDQERNSQVPINLQRAKLLNFNLTGAHLAGIDFSGAVLSGATLTNADLSGGIFTGTDLSSAKLQGANLSSAALTGATLIDARLDGSDLQEADLSAARLNSAHLTGAMMAKVILSQACLHGADLSDANLTGARLIGADLSGAIMRGCILEGAVATRVLLLRAQLCSARMAGADLTGAQLTSADLSDADCTNCRLAEAELFDAVFARAIMRGVYLPGLSHFGQRLDGAITDPDQELPEGWRRDPASGGLARIDRD